MASSSFMRHAASTGDVDLMNSSQNHLEVDLVLL
jgi:hypothetical protein